MARGRSRPEDGCSCPSRRLHAGFTVKTLTIPFAGLEMGTLKSGPPGPPPVIYVAPSAVIVGDVSIGKGSSVWHGAVVRGDLDRIVIGEHCSIQDAAVVHVDYETPTAIGSRVTIGHAAVAHGCTVGDDCLIGMNATIASRA